jgi:hypothetical protein
VIVLCFFVGQSSLEDSEQVSADTAMTDKAGMLSPELTTAVLA